MNQDKTRELFSEYREGTLNASLMAAVQSSLASDETLRQEYAEFDHVLSSLEQSSDEKYDVPFDLHDRIMARIDKSIFEERRKTKANWFSGWRLGTIGAVAAIGLVATFVSINSSNNGSTSTASTLGVPSNPGLSLVNKEGQLIVKHPSANGRSVLVKDEASGKLVKRFDLKGRSLESPQENGSDSAVLLRIEAVDANESNSYLVAVPGKKVNTNLTGKGTISDLAKVLADTYREPVEVAVSDTSVQVGWVLEPVEATHARASQGKFSVERRRGLLHLVD